MEKWKMAKYNDKYLYRLVSTAREQTAGSDVQDKNVVIQSLTTALNYALKVKAPTEISRKIENCIKMVTKCKLYSDRLAIDDILCGMLNDEIGE
jgi:hypothetical protein